MDPWSIARSLLGPLAVVRRRLKKWGADRQALVREGSAAVTPVIEFSREVGPVAASSGDDAEIAQRFGQWFNRWDGLRTALLTYTNAHPSERIRQLGAEVVDSVWSQISAARYLSFGIAGNEMQAYEDARDRQNEAVAIGERLLDEIRSY